jgi:hypothetical protein
MPTHGFRLKIVIKKRPIATRWALALLGLAVKSLTFTPPSARRFAACNSHKHNNNSNNSRPGTSSPGCGETATCMCSWCFQPFLCVDSVPTACAAGMRGDYSEVCRFVKMLSSKVIRRTRCGWTEYEAKQYRNRELGIAARAWRRPNAVNRSTARRRRCEQVGCWCAAAEGRSHKG